MIPRVFVQLRVWTHSLHRGVQTSVQTSTLPLRSSACRGCCLHHTNAKDEAWLTFAVPSHCVLQSWHVPPFSPSFLFSLATLFYLLNCSEGFDGRKKRHRALTLIRQSTIKRKELPLSTAAPAFPGNAGEHRVGTPASTSV